MPYFSHLLRDVTIFFQKGLICVFCLIATAGLIFGLTGCSTLDSRENIVKIRFSTWGSSEEVELIRKRILEFEKKYPYIKVELIHIPENYFQKLHIMIAGNLTPDVMFINSLSFPVYAENKILQPLDELPKEFKSELEDGLFFEQALKALSWKGHLYAIPRDISNLVVFYNQDMFKDSGISEPSVDWTLNDLVETGKQLTRDLDKDGSLDQFGISFFGKPPLFWLPFVWSQGGDLFSEDFTQFKLQESESIKAVQFYSDLRNRWHIAPSRKDFGGANMSQLFLQEKLAMLVSGRWSVPVFRKQAKFHWDIVPFPRGKSGSVVGIDASGYAISEKSRHLKESWMLVSFLSSLESQKALSESGLIIPARKDVAQSEGFREGLPLHGHYFTDIIPKGYPSHTPIRWNEIAEELNLALEPVWEGTKSAEVAIKQVAPKIEKLMQ